MKEYLEVIDTVLPDIPIGVQAQADGAIYSAYHEYNRFAMRTGRRDPINDDDLGSVLIKASYELYPEDQRWVCDYFHKAELKRRAVLSGRAHPKRIDGLQLLFITITVLVILTAFVFAYLSISQSLHPEDSGLLKLLDTTMEFFKQVAE